jgi:selenocysteine-specific elongation factor
MVAGSGDRFVVRKYSPPRVVGGGIVLDARAEKHRRNDAAVVERLRVREQGDPETLLVRAVERAGMAGASEAEVDAVVAAPLLARGELVAIAGRLYHHRALDDLAARASEMITAHIARNPLQWGIGKEELRQRLSFPHPAATFNRVIEALAPGHALFIRNDRVRAGSPEPVFPPGLTRALADLRERIRAAGVTFPSRAELERAWTAPEKFQDALQILRDSGEAADVGDGVMHRDALAGCLETLRGLFATRGELSVADLRAALGISRKHAVPLLEYLDSRRFTVRRGDVRVPGSALSGGGRSS